MTSFSSSWVRATRIVKQLWLCLLAAGTLTGCGPAPVATPEPSTVVASADQQSSRSTATGDERANESRRRRSAEADDDQDATPERRDEKTPAKVPAKVTRVLRYIDEHH